MVKNILANKEKQINLKIFGFTLIELLAVIVILAIIALIATPIILGIIKDAKEESTKRSAELYIDAVEQAIIRKNLEGEYNPKECKIESGEVTCEGKFSTTHCEIKDGQLNCEGVSLEVEIDGEVPQDGIIVFQNGKAINGTELTFKEYGVNINQQGKMEINSIVSEDSIPKNGSFSSDSWDTIAKNVKSGNLSQYNVGDKKEIILTGFANEENENETTYTVRIANISTPDECNNTDFSQTACGFVIEFEDIITEYGMNLEPTNEGGYPASLMYKYIQNDVYKSLPEELKKVIIYTKVISSHGSTPGETNFISEDKLYLLSVKEVWGKYGLDETADKQTRQLDYYKSLEKENDFNFSGVIKKYNGSAHLWLLRSAGIYNNDGFHLVSAEGDPMDGLSEITDGVSPAFRIG